MKNYTEVGVREFRNTDLARISELDVLNLSEAWDASSLEEFLAGARTGALVAEFDSTIRGFLLWHQLPDAFEIIKLVVDRAFRRRGLASSLFLSFECSAVGNVEKLWLEVRESNLGAIGFYLSRGFLEVGRRESYYSKTGDAAILMSKSLLANNP